MSKLNLCNLHITLTHTTILKYNLHWTNTNIINYLIENHQSRCNKIILIEMKQKLINLSTSS